MRADNQSKLRVTASDLQSDLSLPKDLNGSCASAGPMRWRPHSFVDIEPLYIDGVYYIRGTMDRVGRDHHFYILVLSVLATWPHHFPPRRISDS